jgi:predicted phosphodiesterase
LEFKRNENENEEQFLWRIGQAKDNGVIDLDWSEIADIMNAEFRADESEYRNESAYRKPYQYCKRMYEAGVFKQYEKDSYVDGLIAAKDEVRKEKQKLFDERKALNKISRENARAEENLLKLEELIRENGQKHLPEVHYKTFESGNDLIIALSDFHLGAEFDNSFGFYNSDVAKSRLVNYLNRIIEIQKIHSAENAYLFLLGDSISGNIHWTTQLENRENVIEQVQTCAELISDFTYEISKHFKTVSVGSVSGNHSRLGLKDHVLRNERLDDLIVWYMKAKLSHIRNLAFIINGIDDTIGHILIRGKSYCYVHGDYDQFSEAGLSKLVMMIGFKPNAVFYGHMHHCSYDDIAGIKMIRSGSFCGTGDDFTVSKRIYGEPQQMVVVVNDNGVMACYPVDLNDNGIIS